MFKSKQLKQDWNKDLPKYWYDESPLKTHFFNAMSITFPKGETMFVDIVKVYSQHITDPRIKENCVEFVKQEYWHTFAHKQFNRWISNQGLPVNSIEEHLDKKIQLIRKSPKVVWLGFTAGIEHVTTVLATHVLTYPGFIEKMHPHFKELWLWHSKEEVEHQAVTLEIWNELNIPRKNLRLIMTIAAIITVYCMLYYTYLLLKHDKQLWKWRTVKDAMSLFFSPKDGLIKSLWHWFRCWKPNFLPNPVEYQHLTANK